MRRDDWFVGQLPMGMLDDNLFFRFASMFQEVATTHLDNVDNIPNLVDLSVAPEQMVRWMATWLGSQSIDSSLPTDLQRRILRESGLILAWRGTRRGLTRFLELLSGDQVEINDSGSVVRQGQGGGRDRFVSIRVTSTGWMSNEDFIEVVRDELPANVRFELFVGEHQIWPTDEPEP
jgi:phage tail-like protein